MRNVTTLGIAGAAALTLAACASTKFNSTLEGTRQRSP